MKIEVKDLMVGDEIIVPSQAKLKYVKVLAAPKSTKLDYRGNPFYKTVKCSIKSVQTTLPVNHYRHKIGVKNDYQFETDVLQHNAKIYLNLNYTDIFLVKRDVI
jgi:hypothetical protein